MINKKYFLKEHSSFDEDDIKNVEEDWRFGGEDYGVGIIDIHETQIDKQKVKEAIDYFGARHHILATQGFKDLKNDTLPNKSE